MSKRVIFPVIVPFQYWACWLLGSPQWNIAYNAKKILYRDKKSVSFGVYWLGKELEFIMALSGEPEPSETRQMSWKKTFNRDEYD